MTFSITNSRRRTPIAALSMAAAAVLCSPFVSADQGGSAAAKARYEQERSRCLSGQSGQPLQTCLREAGAALQEARQGRLDDHDARYMRNALERCKPLPSDEAKDCRDRLQGQGTVSGTVKGGGLYREKSTKEVYVLPPVDTQQPPPPSQFQPQPQPQYQPPPPPMPPPPPVN
jgi:hypothetical protein